MAITKAQAEVLVILENMKMKKVVMYCIIVAFFLLLIFFILLFTCIQSHWSDKVIVGSVDSILAGTMYPLVNHFFPAFKVAKDNEREGIQ